MARCMRIESDKPSNGGWIHRLNGSATLPLKRKSKTKATVDLEKLALQYQRAVEPDELDKFAASLGVDVDALRRLSVGIEVCGNWTFPMREADGSIIGIRIRSITGANKWSVKGGRNGLFLPLELSATATLFIAEGPTDCAALLTVALDAIARPDCTGGVSLLREYCKRRDVVLAADADEQGRKGAESLARKLVSVCHSVRIIRPPDGLNDMREWVQAGATKLDIEAAVRQVDPIEPSKSMNRKTDLSSSADIPTMSPEDRIAALALLRNPELLREIVDDVARLGVAGEKQLTATIYLVGTSRLLTKPLAAIVQGLTSSGKSYVIDTVAKLFPPETVLKAHRMTPQALVHLPTGTLIHRFVVAGERSRKQDDDTADATRALREMLSDGKLTKLMPTRVAGGRIETVHYEQAGPIAYVESTTLQNILDEDRNRCLVLTTDETPTQTARTVSSMAERKQNRVDDARLARVIARHHAAQRLLCKCSVRVPFAVKLAEAFPCDRTDARRMFSQLLSLIEAVTVLHQYQRTPDPCDDCEIVATMDDYSVARRLLAEPFARCLADGVSAAACRFLARLRESFGFDEFDSNDAAHDLVIGDKQTIRAYLRALTYAGHLEQTEPARGQRPARYKVSGNTGAAELVGLPTIEELEQDDTHLVSSSSLGAL